MVTENTELPQAVKVFLEEKGFQLKTRLKNARYLLLQVSALNSENDLLLKIGKGKDSLQQRNHVLWTKSVEHTVPKEAPFHIAPILEDGTINGIWYWFTTPFIDGTPFAEKGEDDVSKITSEHPEEVLSNIILLMRHIENVDALGANDIDARYGALAKKRDRLELLDTAIKWARNDTPYLAELLQLIQANYTYLGTTNAHGDFTDVNLIIDPKGEPVLIDAEISSTHHYKYYDVAEFYNRLFTRSCAPDLAQTFLAKYAASLPVRSRQKFLNNFLCLSALRCIGNFMEIATFPESSGKKKRLEYAKRYAESIVTYEIIELATDLRNLGVALDDPSRHNSVK